MTDNPNQSHPEPPPAAELPSFSLPDHELLRCIGRGSYGEVWIARNVLGALRAVKVVRRSSFHDARPYEREFSGILRVEPLSRAHEGLLDILHVGRHEPEGFFYYVMELADPDGDSEAADIRYVQDIAHYTPRTLAQEIHRRGRLPFGECVQLALRISGALSHIHRNGLVHRDVKPSNILYVDGVAKLGDIGLVEEAGGSASYVGTEGYIPPEGPGSARADVYGLGKVLYEAFTGQDRKEFPRLPAELGDEHAQQHMAELNEIVLKACHPDPARRYASADLMHADLALLHRGQSARQHRRARQRWHLARVALCFALFAAGIGLGALWSPIQRWDTRHPAGTPHPINLVPYQNARLHENWLHDLAGNDLSSLSTNWQKFGPAWFKPAGLIQLRGGYTQGHNPGFPAAVEGIVVDQRCTRLHFLHGAVWQDNQGAHVGSYVIHYASGRHEGIPLQYGFDLLNWWWDTRSGQEPGRATLAWQGTNSVTAGGPSLLRLYCTTWNNPLPNDPITRLDFVSTGSASSPFLVAITAE